MVRTKMLRKICIEEDGSSLFLVSMLLLLGLLLAAGVFCLSNVAYRSTIHTVDAVKARYIAEAGIYRTIAQIERNPDWTGGYPSTPFGEGNFFVQVTAQEIQETNGEPANNSLNPKQHKPAKIFHLHAEGVIASRARSIIEASYKSDTGEIVAWSE